MSPKVELRTAEYDHLPGQERPRTMIRPFTLAANSSASVERTSIFLGSLVRSAARAECIRVTY